MNDAHRAVIAALCGAVVPALAHELDPDGFFARTPEEIGVPRAMNEALAALPQQARDGLLELLEVLADQGFPHASRRSREQILRNVALSGAAAAAGVDALIGMTLFLYYGLPDERGQNPSWRTFGYPGPMGAPPDVARELELHVPAGDSTLEADVCVVGSGAGGGVMAGVLAKAGLKVVVVEAGGYFDDRDFLQLELPAYQGCYWRGGPTPTVDLNVSLQAGRCVGGGTVINWTNCLRTTPWVREQWEREFGLEGVAGPAFDAHLAAIFERLSVNDRCSDLNPPQQAMKEAAGRLGWRFSLTERNVDERRYAYETAGYIGFGDQSGAKLSTAKTFLADAQANGATMVACCRAERVLVERERAAGVLAGWCDPLSGRSASVTVRAPQVVVAAGALESPALLLRSQIGGEAVGNYLRLHPAIAVSGMHGRDMEAWKGAPHAGLIHEFESMEDGHGFLIEGAQYTTAIGGASFPFTGGEAHKLLMARYREGATYIALLRDRGHGRVSVDAEGEALPAYSISDALDVDNLRKGVEALARLHEAAGAVQIVALAAGAPMWRIGDDLGAFVDRARRVPFRAGGWRVFSAHQMGTCRMGTDRRTSVAGPWGELHDVKGVWIGDGSAFPTASGTNPMISIMALAHRNAQAVAAAASDGARASAPS
ncbi:MAG: GMC family oxidoreductase N-terminal domain-containing protein [Solirubrobacteraceae bacterium]